VKNENTGEISPEGNNTKSSLEKPLELIQEVVEERLQKQTMDLQQLKSALEMKVWMGILVESSKVHAFFMSIRISVLVVYLIGHSCEFRWNRNCKR